MLDRREERRRRAAHRLRRRIGGLQLREAVLERAQLAHQVVVLGVGHLGVVEDVIAVAMVLDLGPELLDAELGLRALALVGGGLHAGDLHGAGDADAIADDHHPSANARDLLQVVQRHPEAVRFGEARLDARRGRVGQHAALRDHGEPVGSAAATPAPEGG